jgi:hypothetical protein
VDELQKKREERTALEPFPRYREIYTLALAKDKKFGLSLFTGFAAFLVATLSVRFFVASSDVMHGRARTASLPWRHL